MVFNRLIVRFWVSGRKQSNQINSSSCFDAMSSCPHWSQTTYSNSRSGGVLSQPNCFSFKWTQWSRLGCHKTTTHTSSCTPRKVTRRTCLQ